MEPAISGWTNVLGDIGGKGDHIVIERALQFLATLHIESGARSYLGKILPGDQALGTERLCGEQLDLEPGLELMLFAPDFPHRWTGVTLNHAGEFRVSSGECRGSASESSKFRAPSSRNTPSDNTQKSKFQIPIKSQISSSKPFKSSQQANIALKFGIRDFFGAWILGFGASLELGAWNLELLLKDERSLHGVQRKGAWVRSSPR